MSADQVNNPSAATQEQIGLATPEATDKFTGDKAPMPKMEKTFMMTFKSGDSQAQKGQVGDYGHFWGCRSNLAIILRGGY
jgi:hypothetical protein